MILNFGKGVGMSRVELKKDFRSQIRDVLVEHGCNFQLVDRLLDYLLVCYSESNFIIPVVVHRECGIPILTVFTLLDALVGTGFLTSELLLQCEKCGYIDDSVAYATFKDCPAWISCPKCGFENDGMTETIIVYKFLAK